MSIVGKGKEHISQCILASMVLISIAARANFEGIYISLIAPDSIMYDSTHML